MRFGWIKLVCKINARLQHLSEGSDVEVFHRIGIPRNYLYHIKAFLERREKQRMYHIRKFAEKDLEQIKDINVMLWLCVQWNGTYHKEDVFVAADEEENVIGVAALFYDGIWYYIEKNRDDIPLYRLQFELSVKENCSEEKEIRRLLLQALKERLKEFSNCYPDKRIAMRCWCEDTAKTDMQFYLQEGFYTGGRILAGKHLLMHYVI